jgi:dynein heavy chain
MKNILGMYSSEGEYVKFTSKINTTLARGNVDQWLIQVEAAMIENVKREVQEAHAEFARMNRRDWVLARCGMAVLNVDMAMWTADVESTLKKGKGLVWLLEKMNKELGYIIELIRSPTLKELDRLTL